MGLHGFGDLTLSYGGRFGTVDGGETPNVQSVHHKFGNQWIFHDIVGLPKKPYKNVQNGIVFYGTEGTIIYQNGAATLTDSEGNTISRFEGKQENHYRNFIDAIINNDPGEIVGDIYEAHVSSGLCHLGNISQRLGSLACDEEIMKKLHDIKAPLATKQQLKRLRNNLSANGINENFTLGVELKIEAKNGAILDNKDAFDMMTKQYREGFGLYR
jgi:hypothetical protein